MWKFFLCLSCVIALIEKPSGGIVLAEFHFSRRIDCASTDVFLPSPSKVRMCGAIHIDWWIKWAAESTRMNFVFVYLCLLLILIVAGHWSTHGTSVLCLLLNEVLYHALISLLSHTPVKENTSVGFLLRWQHTGNHSGSVSAAVHCKINLWLMGTRQTSAHSCSCLVMLTSFPSLIREEAIWAQTECIQDYFNLSMVEQTFMNSCSISKFISSNIWSYRGCPHSLLQLKIWCV